MDSKTSGPFQCVLRHMLDPFVDLAIQLKPSLTKARAFKQAEARFYTTFRRCCLSRTSRFSYPFFVLTIITCSRKSLIYKEKALLKSMYNGFRIPQVLGHWKKHVEQTILTKHVWLDYVWRLSTNTASGTLHNFVVVE